jgi:hypothetical protein
MNDPALATAAYWAPLLTTVADIAFAVVIVALAVELVSGRLAKRFERQIEQVNELKIAELTNETTRMRMPRSLNIEKFRDGIADIAPQDFEVLYDANTPDAKYLSITIAIGLRLKGWRTTQQLPEPLSSLPEQAGGASSGVSVVTKGPFHEPHDKSPANLLALALSKAVIGPPLPTTENTDPSVAPGIIRVIVASKLP